MRFGTFVAAGATIVAASVAAALGAGGGTPAAVTALAVRGPEPSGNVRECTARHAPQPNAAGELTPLAPTGEPDASVHIVFDGEDAHGCAA